jgi:hypothetical protein
MSLLPLEVTSLSHLPENIMEDKILCDAQLHFMIHYFLYLVLNVTHHSLLKYR